MSVTSLAGPRSSGAARSAEALALPALLLITALAWIQVPWGTFQFDDFLNVVRDPATTDAAALLERLQHGLRPLTRISYFVDAQLFGLNPGGFLATNLLLHLVATALVFGLARQRVDAAPALLAGLIFALQPANAEVVAYVSGRSTGLMTVLLLGGLLLHDRKRPAGAYVLFALACLAKEVALVFPLLLLAWESTRARPRPEAVREITIALALSVILAAALLALEGYRSLIQWSLAFRSIADNLLANARAIPTMLSLWVRPWALSVDHDFDARADVAASVAGLVLIALLAGSAFALRRRRPLAALALLWPLLALLPTNSLIAKIDLVTEKPLYLAWVGPAIALGAGAAALLTAASSRAIRALGCAALAAVLLAMAIATAQRASLWRDPVALWTDAVAKAPDKARCWNNLGTAYLVSGRDEEAVEAFGRAVALEPRNAAARMNLHAARALCGSRCAR